MRLLSLSKYLLIFIFVTIISIFAKAEEESVDLWKKEIKKQESLNVPTEEESKKKIKIKTEKKNQEIVSTDIKISNNTQTENSERAIYGIFDPQQNNFTLEMWSNTKGEDIKSVFNRVNKIKLSKSAEDIFINTIMTYSYLPENMSDEDFLNLKINWLIKNDKIDLLEDFLDKNNNFKGKKKMEARAR